MRRILEKLFGNSSKMGDTSTLLDPNVVEHICDVYSKLIFQKIIIL